MTVAELIEKLQEMPAGATVQVNPGGKFHPLDAVAIALHLYGKPVLDNVPLGPTHRFRVEIW